MKSDDIYTPLREAEEEIKRRWGDQVLRKQLDDILGDILPDVFKKEPRAILCRAILTPNFEINYFIDLMNLVHLKPVCGEMRRDKFCTMNKDKIHLGKLVFLHKSKKGNDVTNKKIIIDFNKSANKSFEHIKTLNNRDFIEFHHQLYVKQYKKIMDIVNLYGFIEKGEGPNKFYETLFLLCLSNAILFDNFIAKEHEHEKIFTEEVVLPAFESIVKKYNLKPLVVQLLPLEDEEKEKWMWYPGHLEEEVDNIF